MFFSARAAPLIQYQQVMGQKYRAPQHIETIVKCKKKPFELATQTDERDK